MSNGQFDMSLKLGIGVRAGGFDLVTSEYRRYLKAGDWMKRLPTFLPRLVLFALSLQTGFCHLMSHHFFLFCCLFKQCLFIFERERERDKVRTSQGGAERGGDRESEAGAALTAQIPMWGSHSRTTRSRPALKSDAYLAEPPRCPFLFFF